MTSQDIDYNDLQNCVHCGRGLMHSGAIHFYEVTANQCILDMKTIRELQGLETMMGEAAPLAKVFAPSTRIALRVGEPSPKLVCSECAMDKHYIHDYSEE